MTKREEVARAMGKARSEYLGSKAIQAAHPEGCDLYTLDAALAVLREPSEADWAAYKERYPMFGPPEHIADEGRVEKYYTRLRRRMVEDRYAMIDQILKEGE